MMHGNLEPEEHVWGDHVNDLWEDMERLNALYEELMWDHEDELQFTIVGNKIVITNLDQEE